MIDLIKNAFLDVKEELVKDIIKIEGPFLQDVFTALYFILIFLLIAVAIKNAKDFYKLRSGNRKTKRNIEKMIMTSFLAGKDKNKETKNIK